MNAMRFHITTLKPVNRFSAAAVGRVHTHIALAS